MKKVLMILAVGIFFSVAAKELKVLMIGNSFSICVGRNLPHLVAHEKKHSIELTSAYIGGCVFERHAKNLKIAEADPKAELYVINVWNSGNPAKTITRKGNVNELLKNNKYDIITIQQGSPQSWDYKFYQPHANELIAYIKKFNPKAEIVIQQTWAYRADSPKFAQWKFGQEEMSDRIIATYSRLAKENNFRIIPVGEGVALARKSPYYQYTVPSRKQIEAFIAPDLPPRSSDPVGRHFWYRKGNKQSLGIDAIHLNEHGQYLQACIWYSFLFNEDAEKITYTRPDLSGKSCRILRKLAAETMKKYNK
ncbi:MAG: DUF4886 domain-containing protein [Lentisphaerae bacterium]|nr:DUF4886 domain-containing protein [Lentisphaerota bacterium]